MEHVQIVLNFSTNGLGQGIQITQNPIDRAIFLNKLHRCLLTDSFYTGIVIACIAHETFEIDDLPRNQLLLFHQTLRRVDHIIAVAFLHNHDARKLIDQLQHVMISGQNVDLHILAETGSQTSDTIVGFITGTTDVRNVQALHHFLNDCKLGNQIVRCFGAIPFIGCVIYPLIGNY